MKEIILYNLKDEVSEEQYEAFYRNKKGPTFAAFSSCRSVTLNKVVSAKSGDIPYRYVAVVEIADPAGWEKDTASGVFQEIIREWGEMVKEGAHILFAEEVGRWEKK
ncbi:MAG: hypothetical protein ACPLPT_01165 [Moorellales bacterium]